jgi:hypothetical protein
VLDATCCLTTYPRLWSAAVNAAERGQSSPAAARRRSAGPVARALPWLVTVAIFALIFTRVPFARVWEALAGADLVPYLAVMMPYSAFYLAIDTFCLTRVINWFNCRIAYRDVLPIRATTYLLTLVNANLGQGGLAVYLNRRYGVPLPEVVSSVLFLMFVELYQLTVFSTLGVMLAPRPIDLPLRAVYAGLYGYLAVHLLVFSRFRDRLARVRWGRFLHSFRIARPRHYLLLLLYKSPNFLMATVVYYFALRRFGITVPYRELLVYLPLIFFSAALPIGVAHLGAPQLLWIYFFGRYAPEASLLAFSLATHFIFMMMNAALGVPFLPRAMRELAVGADDNRAESHE